MVEEVLRLFKELEREKSHAKRWAISESLYVLYNSLSEEDKKLVNREYMSADTYFRSGVYMTYLLHNLDLHESIIDNVKNAYVDSLYTDYSIRTNKKVQRKKADEIISSILDDMGEEYFNVYKECKDKVIIDSNYDGVAACVNNLGKQNSYLFVNNNQICSTIEYIYFVMHEIGHAYENKFMSSMSYEQQIDRYSHMYYEVISHFFEKVSSLYLKNNHLYLDDSNIFINNRYYFLLSCFCDLDFIIYGVQKNKIGLSYEGQFLVLDDSIYDDYDLNQRVFSNDTSLIYYGDYDEMAVYGYGCLLAEYFFDIYKEDKKEGLKTLKNFISKQALVDDGDLLKELDLEHNDFSFLKKGIIENKEYMRKRYKW